MLTLSTLSMACALPTSVVVLIIEHLGPRMIGHRHASVSRTWLGAHDLLSWKSLSLSFCVEQQMDSHGQFCCLTRAPPFMQRAAARVECLTLLGNLGLTHPNPPPHGYWLSPSLALIRFPRLVRVCFNVMCSTIKLRCWVPST